MKQNPNSQKKNTRPTVTVKRKVQSAVLRYEMIVELMTDLTRACLRARYKHGCATNTAPLLGLQAGYYYNNNAVKYTL